MIIVTEFMNFLLFSRIKSKLFDDLKRIIVQPFVTCSLQ